jgi:hypothetical protein
MVTHATLVEHVTLIEGHHAEQTAVLLWNLLLAVLLLLNSIVVRCHPPRVLQAVLKAMHHSLQEVTMCIRSLQDALQHAQVPQAVTCKHQHTVEDLTFMLCVLCALHAVYTACFAWVTPRPLPFSCLSSLFLSRLPIFLPLSATLSHTIKDDCNQRRLTCSTQMPCLNHIGQLRAPTHPSLSERKPHHTQPLSMRASPAPQGGVGKVKPSPG